MAALVLPEYYADLAQTTLSSSYTAGAGVIVVTTAANLSTTRQFHFMITDQTTGAVKCIGKATALTSSTFTVTMTTDANAASGDFVTITLCAAAEDQIRADACQFGTYANLPTIAKAGDYYKQSDGLYEWIYQSAAWQAFYNGFPATVPPAAGSWTTENLGSHGALTSTYGNNYLIGSNSTNSDFLTMAYMAAPGSTPYSFTARVVCESSGLIESITRGSIAVGNNIGFAIGWRDGSGKYVVLMVESYNSSPYWYVLASQWSSFSSVNASPLTLTFAGEANLLAPGGCWFKIQNDGTNLNFYISIDGKNFALVYTQTITHYLAAATSVAWGTYGHNESATIALYDWTQGT